MSQKRGFTLIELMIVVAIIGVLSTLAVPTYQDFVVRAQISEGLKLAEPIQRAVETYYQTQQHFPENNATAGVPQSQHLIGNYVSSIEVSGGAIHITLGHRVNANVANKVLSLRPATVIDSPSSPLSWVCGYAEPVPGMQAAGNNRTDVPSLFVSLECRQWQAAS